MTPIIKDMTILLNEVQKIKNIDIDGMSAEDDSAFQTLNKLYDAVQKSQRWENFYREKWEERKFQTDRMRSLYLQQSKKVRETLAFRQRDLKRQKKRTKESEEKLIKRKDLKKSFLARRESGEDWKSFVQRENLDAGNPPNLLAFLALEKDILNDKTLDE